MADNRRVLHHHAGPTVLGPIMFVPECLNCCGVHDPAATAYVTALSAAAMGTVAMGASACQVPS